MLPTVEHVATRLLSDRMPWRWSHMPMKRLLVDEPLTQSDIERTLLTIKLPVAQLV
jgi:hypothetical protein